MSSIYKEIDVDVPPATAWAALREVGKPHELFAPVLAASDLKGDIRTVRFTNGMVVREQILDVDEGHRRVAYTVLDAPGLSYHHSSMQIEVAEDGLSRFTWTTDFLPHEAGQLLAPLIDQGASALKTNLETSSAAAAKVPISERV